MPIDRDERTEPATPRRRGEAHARGQIPRSHDLVAAVLLLAGFLAVDVLGSRIWWTLFGVMRTGLSPREPWSLQESLPFAMSAARTMFGAIWPFLLVLTLAVAGVLFAQVGPLLTLHPVTPTLSRLNPLNGIQRIFSAGSVVRSGLNALKLVAVGSIAYLALAGSASSIIYVYALDTQQALLLGAQLTVRLGITLAICFLVLSLFDYAWQRFQHERNLRMTKEEVKDELRSMEGDPAIKQRRRRLQLQLAMQRLKKDVPKADVIIANPTHLAIALAYDGATMPAPKVVAKGADYMAIRIRQIALEHGIPVVERRPLARALFDAVDVGHYIPERFYQAIAEILAYVYELSGKSPATQAERG